MAAQPIVRDSYKEPVYTYEVNVMGTVNILECVRLSDSGLRTIISFFPAIARIQSGIILSLAKSPPPITFPARAVETAISFSLTGYALNPPTEPSLFEMCGIASHMHSVIGDIRDLQCLKKTFEESNILFFKKRIFIAVCHQFGTRL